jgi:DNA excision repair protein ERCC-2
MEFDKTAHSYFPYDTIREGQRELLKNIYDTITTNSILLANAPTGLGKTASVFSVALKYALEHNKKIFFLTNRHTQHNIAVETLKDIKQKFDVDVSCVDMIGKKHMCNQEVAGLYGTEFTEYCKSVVTKGECEYYTNFRSSKGVSVEGKVVLKVLQHKGPLHNEELKIFSQEHQVCAYELSIERAKKAQVIIADYNYIFNPYIRELVLPKLDIGLDECIVVVDEAHNLPSRVTNMLSANLTTTMLRNAIAEAEKFRYDGMVEWLSGLREILEELNEVESRDGGFNVHERLVTQAEFEHKVQTMMNYDELVEELTSAADEIRKKQKRSYLGGVVSFLEAWQGDNQGFSRIITESMGSSGKIITLSYSCLDPSLVTKDIFAGVHSAILMSGTLHPTFMYKDLLGIDTALQETYSSPFPTENKLTLIVPETTTKYSGRTDSMFDKIAARCSEMCRLIPGNVAIFFPSYAIRDRIAERFRSSKKQFIEERKMTKVDKTKFLDDFKAHKDLGGVLLGVTGANFAEGVDFPGDLLQGVIVVGVPLARPDLNTRKTIEYYETKYGKGWNYAYIFPAINKCLQSAGRCIRSETDRGVVIYLDERFAWQNYFQCFPKEGLIVAKEYQSLLYRFFNSNAKS